MGYPQFTKAPFRKRRPVLFFFLLFFGGVVVLYAIFSWLSALEEKGVFSGPRLGLVRVEGFIGDSEKVVEWTERLRRDPTIAGVLLRVDSPGGAVAPSQEMHSAVARLAKEKPVIVSMGATAASGGYYVAVAGKEIFANPATLTGSIGVRLQLTNVQALMERVGVRSESLATGKFKTAGSPFQPLTEEERIYLQSVLDDMQDEFVSVVAKGRSLSLDEVKAIADGRVMTGRQALAAKLVDHIGDQQAAVARLTALCGLEGEPKIVAGPEKSKSWWKTLLEAALELDAAESSSAARYAFYY